LQTLILAGFFRHLWLEQHTSIGVYFLKFRKNIQCS
jgi:hypothetical protein